MLIDSHCHLADTKFSDDLPNVIDRALKAGVSIMITIADDLSEADRCKTIADTYQNVFYTAGIHPHNAKHFSANRDLPILKDHAKHQKCKAIGEIGLDYHYMNSPKEDQVRAFESQLLLAKELDLPAVVHTRDAIDDTKTIIRHIKPRMLVLHCCTEKWDDVSDIVEMGYFLSFTGIATYPKADDIRNTIKHCPLDQMMIETDAPYLAPERYRGKRNEPAFVAEVSTCVGDLKNLSLESVATETTKNAKMFYGI